jgi:hypothetical protein
MCNCLDKMEKMIKGKIISTRKEKGQSGISEFVDESESGFTCKGLSFASGKWEFILPVQFKYILEKKDGTPEKRTTTYKTNLYPSFCPVCGKKTKK